MCRGRWLSDEFLGKGQQQMAHVVSLDIMRKLLRNKPVLRAILGHLHAAYVCH